MIVESTSRGGSLLKSNEVRLVLYVVGALLFLIVTYLLLRYSVALGVLWIGLLVFVVAMVRRARGSQTSLEQQAFQAADRYRESARRASEETQMRYRQWNEAQATERQRNEALRAIQRERNARRARFDRYVAFFERVRSGTQTYLEWWQAYEEEEEEEGAGDEEQTTNELLASAQERAEAALVEMRGYEEAFASLLQADSFGEADDFLNRMLAGQEDFEGEDSVFPPLVAVHERIKHSERWATYRRELEKFVKDLEDLLDSSAVRTVPANRVRFPEPGQEHPSQPEVSYPHYPTPEADVPVPPLPSEPLTGQLHERTRTAPTSRQWMVIGAVFVALVILIGILLSISNPQDESASHRGGGWEVGDEVTFEAEVFGYAEQVNYDGAQVLSVIVDYHGAHVAVLADPLNGPGMSLAVANPGQRIRVTGTYQGTVHQHGGGDYPGVLAEDLEIGS
jgi:hypothetical protein